MGENDVIINFVGNTEQLKPAEDAMDTIIAKEGEVGEAWKKTAALFTSQNKDSISSTTKLGKSIETLAVAAKSMDKAVIGGAYKDYLKQIQQQLGLTSKELVTYVQNARKAAQEAVVTAQTQEEADALTLSIETMNEQLVALASNEEQTGTKTQSLRARIREAKEELVAMAEAGLQGTPAFEALQNKAGELDDQMKDLNATISNTGSDTRNVEGLISLASGASGAFAIAQGAAALFGSENEEVQKALLKVNAAMSILQGLEQIQNVLQKESAGSLLLKRIFLQQTTVATEGNAIATGVQTAVTEEQVVVTDAATVSQIALNTAMELNPIAIVIAALVALVAIVAVLATNNKEAEQTKRDLNDALKDANDYLDIDLKANENLTARRLALAKERGASSVELTKIEADGANKRLKSINDEITAAADALNKAKITDDETLKSYNALVTKKTQLEQQLQDETNALQVKGIEFRKTLADNDLKSFIANQEAKVLATRAGSVAEKNAQIESITATRAAKDKLDPEQTPGEKAKNAAEDARAISDIQLQIYAGTLKSITALDQATVVRKKQDIINNQVDTIASIQAVSEAEIAAIRAAENEQLKTNPNLSAGERAKIEADADLQVTEIKRQNEAKLLDIRKAAINAQLILAVKGTQEEYDARVAAIQNEQDIELSATELTQEKINEINAKAFKERQDALRTLYQAQLQNQISLDSASLNSFGLTENVKLAITLKRLEEQRQLEISQAENNAAKIAEVNAKFDKQILDSKRATTEAILAENLRTFDASSAVQIAANERLLSLEKSTFDQRKEASQQLLKLELDRLQLEANALGNKLIQGTITQKEYDVAIQEIDNKRTAAAIANEEKITASQLKEIQKRTTSLQATFSILQQSLAATLGTSGFTVALTQLQNFGVQVQDVFSKLKDGAKITGEDIQALAGAAIQAGQATINQIFADSSTERQQQLADDLAALEDQKTKEVDNENLTQQQKADIEKKYKAKEAQIRLKEFEAEKEAKKEQAIINGALAITNILATMPKFDFGIASAIAIAAAIASTALQVQAIEKAKPPKFRHGKVDIQGPGTTTSDSIPAMISRGESVIKADATAKWKEALEAINNDNFEHYLKHKMSDFVFPQVPEFLHTATSKEMDYDKLGSTIAKYIPAPVSNNISMDKDGFSHHILDRGSRREIRNQRYKA